MKEKERKPNNKNKSKKKPSSHKTVFSFLNLGFIFHLVKSYHKYKKYFFLGIANILFIVVVAVIVFWGKPILWFVKSSSYQNITYPYASVLGNNVGGLNSEELDTKLAEIKLEFESKKVTFTNNESQWIFTYNELGVRFDSDVTKQAILEFNKYNIRNKYKLIIGDISPQVIPSISIINDKCVNSLSTVSIPETAPQNAAIYFDQELKIKSEQSGTSYNPASNCKELSTILASSRTKAKISLDTVAANLTKADLEPVLPQIQGITGKPLTLYSGSYKRILPSEQLLGLLEISKSDSGIQVGWSSARLDELINGIASKVNYSNSSPVVGSCEYLISNGGYWLDKAATKKFIQSLGPNSSRSYTLPVIYHEAVIGKRSPVKSGTRGTVYLTFDDGLLYGNQIMNYAACYGIKITFFEIGSRGFTDAVALRRAVNEGHAVQSHGYDHAATNYGEHSYEWQFNDIKKSIDTIISITGIRPTYFRPPGGNRSTDTYTAANNNGLKLILWGASSADTAGISSSAICSNVLNHAFSGASVLMHSTKQTTANAVPCIIEGLAARGYSMQALR